MGHGTVKNSTGDSPVLQDGSQRSLSEDRSGPETGMRAIIFDLDDTLYPMEQFVCGGYKAVGEYLAARYRVDGVAFAETCREIYLSRGSTGDILDLALAEMGWAREGSLIEMGWAGEENPSDLKAPGARIPVEPLVEIYREHSPQIELYEDARFFLEAHRERFLYGLITDGNPQVQKRKVAALGLGKYLTSHIYTGEWPGYGKPDPRSFVKAVEELGVLPEEAVYIGDNPYKDFTGARQAGLLTLRLLRGEHRGVTAVEGRRADYEVSNFEEIMNIIQGGNHFA